jgi:hypothetical protein
MIIVFLTVYFVTLPLVFWIYEQTRKEMKYASKRTSHSI